MLHLYALVRDHAAVPDVAAIDDAPVRAVRVDDGVAALVSDASKGQPTEASILAHARVVDAATSANDSVLPARFSGGVPDEDELRRRLAGRRQQILDALDRVEGCVELGIRVLAAEEASPDHGPSSGRDYMQRRLGEVRAAELLARELHRSLDELSRASTSNVLARRDVIFTGAYLVARTDVARFRAAAEAAERADATLVVTGPWPPYSFALLEAGET